MFHRSDECGTSRHPECPNRGCICTCHADQRTLTGDPHAAYRGREHLYDALHNLDETSGAIILEGPEMDRALIGASVDGDRLVYSYDILVDICTEMFGDYDTGAEWVDFNILGLRGDGAPIYVHTR